MKRKTFVLSVAVFSILTVTLVVTGINNDIKGINNKSEISSPWDFFSVHPPPFHMDKNKMPLDPPPILNITEINGILNYDGERFTIGEHEVFFGPPEMIMTSASPFDFDGDEFIKTILGELKGLRGLNVTVNGELQSNGYLTVFEINGMPIGKPPPPPPPHLPENDRG